MREPWAPLARIRSATAFWQPIASRVTMQPSRCRAPSSSGTAVISFDLPSTARWPSARPRSLAERQPARAGPGADQVQWAVLVTAAARAPHGLAVDRDHLALDPVRQRLRPAGGAGLERVRIDQHEHPPERVVRGDAVRQGEEGLEPGPLAAAVELDVLPALGAGEHRADRDRQDGGQLMVAPARLARILEPREARCQTLDHAARPPLRRARNGHHDHRSAALLADA